MLARRAKERGPRCGKKTALVEQVIADVDVARKTECRRIRPDGKRALRQ